MLAVVEGAERVGDLHGREPEGFEEAPGLGRRAHGRYVPTADDDVHIDPEGVERVGDAADQAAAGAMALEQSPRGLGLVDLDPEPVASAPHGHGVAVDGEVEVGLNREAAGTALEIGGKSRHDYFLSAEPPCSSSRVRIRTAPLIFQSAWVALGPVPLGTER